MTFSGSMVSMASQIIFSSDQPNQMVMLRQEVRCWWAKVKEFS